jgi:voltage-gated potassium channel
MDLGRRILNILIVFTAVIGFGTIGYRLIEGWSWVDGFYMAVITVTTVGFGEAHPLSLEGRLFTTILILLGVGAITYAFSALANYLIAGELKGFLEERRMKREIDSMDNHFIVCGYGRMGREVCSELKRQRRSVLVVDENGDSIQQASAAGLLVVHGNPGLDLTLKQSGIERAAGLVAASDNDANNLLVVLSAKALNASLEIVARVSEDGLADKFFRVGARSVFSPYKTGGRRLAQILVQPEVIDFLDVVMHDESLELLLEHFTVAKGSELDGKTLGEAQIRQLTGATVIGLKSPGEGIIPSLHLSTLIKGEDSVIALGTHQQLKELEGMLKH